MNDYAGVAIEVPKKAPKIVQAPTRESALPIWSPTPRRAVGMETADLHTERGIAHDAGSSGTKRH